MELKNVDLNLLLVFNQLLGEKRVSKAAESLGLTQSGVSNALKRLRVLLGDELFVRTVRGMEPTPYALGLAEPIGYALTTIHDTLNEVTHFDPGHAIADLAIERHGVRRNVGLTVAHCIAVGHILCNSSMIATVPERYAMACVKPFGLRYLRHPVPIPEININVFWHAKFNQEPANKWLRTLICETFAGGSDAPSRTIAAPR